MPDELSAQMVNEDPRFLIANRCLRALFPGAVIVAKYAEDAPRLPDGTIAPLAKPTRLEIAFMPPPGLDFDSRHPLFGTMELVEEALAARGAAFADFAEALGAWKHANPDEKLTGDTGAIAAMIEAMNTARDLEARFDAEDTMPGDAGKPTTTDVFFAKRDVDARTAEALAILRVEESHCLAPPKDTRDEVAAVIAAAGDRPGVPQGREGDPVPNPGS